ncbi:hypothetical protein SESBI_02122 [Sesbania bispinosa]|nr:hypothetical protein SESBI_02122 [Sesbania bispinosa]
MSGNIYGQPCPEILKKHIWMTMSVKYLRTTSSGTSKKSIDRNDDEIAETRGKSIPAQMKNDDLERVKNAQWEEEERTNDTVVLRRRREEEEGK